MISRFFNLIVAMWLSLVIACRDIPHIPNTFDAFGGQDTVTVEMPFADGYKALCTQGVGGEYSHSYESTLFDLDFDTPNDRDDLVYAPADGVAYVHDGDLEDGFGLHVNLDLLDGTYLVFGHLKWAFVESGEEVRKGEMLAFEGTTGDSTGDHLHFGRHLGDASEDGSLGTSIRGLKIDVEGVTDASEIGALMAEDLYCDLGWGHEYRSNLETNQWHPNGMLIANPYEETVFLLDEGTARAFPSDDELWDWNYSFEDAVLVSLDEFACYVRGEPMVDGNVRVVKDDGEYWLYLGRPDDPYRRKHRLPEYYVDVVLTSWHTSLASAENIEDLDHEDYADYPASADPGRFRDGTLLKEEGASTVYAVSDGIAMPIEHWDTYLLQGYWDKSILEVPDGAVLAVQGKVGSCSMGDSCLTNTMAKTCGFDLVESGEEPDTDPGPDDEELEEYEVDIDCWPDDDRDGYGAGRYTVYTVPAGYRCFDVAVNLVSAEGLEDCDNENPEIHPYATEICENRVDEDCDGGVDEHDDCSENVEPETHEICWYTENNGGFGEDLTDIFYAELWVESAGWYLWPVATGNGAVTSLCAQVFTESGEEELLNGVFFVEMNDWNGAEIPTQDFSVDSDGDGADDAYEWWTCANWDGAGDYSGRFEVDGAVVEPDVVSNGGTGYDCLLAIP